MNHNNTQSRDKYYATGRLPWYDAQTCLPRRPFLIGIAGGTASGKTTVCRLVTENLGHSWVQIISTDNFYKPLNERDMKNVGDYNFDHPKAFDWDLLLSALEKTCRREVVEIPIYDFTTHSRQSATRVINPTDVLIVEGILCFFDPRIRRLFNLKVFIDTDADLRLIRRLRRDINERNRTLYSVLEQYEKTVKPSYDDFVAPTKKFSDLIVPRGSYNKPAIDFLVLHIRSLISSTKEVFSKDLRAFRFDTSSEIPTTLHILPETPIIRSKHTILRDHESCTEDFHDAVNFLSERVSMAALDLIMHRTLLSSKALENTDINKSSLWENICAVSVVRGGTALESGFCRVFETVSIGSIVIEHSKQNGIFEPPIFHFSKLPPGMQHRIVCLLTAVICTGSKAAMAVRLLLDYGVQQSNLFVLSLISAPEGIQRLNYNFPELHVITSSLDSSLDETGHVIPGCGSFSNRFFVTN